jgi:hypothetical protein
MINVDAHVCPIDLATAKKTKNTQKLSTKSDPELDFFPQTMSIMESLLRFSSESCPHKEPSRITEWRAIQKKQGRCLVFEE